MINDFGEKKMNNSFSDLSSISGKSINVREEKVEIQENVILNLDAPQMKQKKKRTKEDLDKTPLYIFECIFCANEKESFKYFSSLKIHETYQNFMSPQDYNELSQLANFKNLETNKKIKFIYNKIQNLDLIKHFYSKNETVEMRNKFVLDKNIYENKKNKFVPKLNNKIVENIKSKNKIAKIIIENQFLNNFNNNNELLLDIKFGGLEPGFLIKEQFGFSSKNSKTEIPLIISKDSDSSRILTRIDNKKVKLTDLSFESQVHDIYNPKYSSDESKENINLSINISNFSSNVLNYTRPQNIINNNLKTGNSNSEILSPENISLINKSDNLHQIVEDQNFNKNSISLICYSHINKFSLPSSAFNNNNSYLKSNNDSKNNSHMAINDKIFIIEDNSLSQKSSKIKITILDKFFNLPPKSNFINTVRHRDNSKFKNINGNKSNEAKNVKLTTPKQGKKYPQSKKQENILFNSIENFTLKKKVFPTSFYSSNLKKSDVHAKINMNNYETNVNNAILLSSNEKKPPIENSKYHKGINSHFVKSNNNLNLLEFNNTVKNFDFYNVGLKENSFSKNKYSFKVNRVIKI